LILIVEQDKPTNLFFNKQYLATEKSKKNASFFNLFLKALCLQGIQNENNFCKVSIFLGLEGINVGLGAVVDKEKAKD
jgi:hypothetical protein